MRVCFLLLFLLPAGGVLFGQPQNEESLLHVVQTATHESTKIRALCLLSRIHRDDNSKSYRYANQAFTIATQSNWKQGMPLCYRTFGYLYGRFDYAKGLKYFLKSLQLSEALHDTTNMALALSEIGNNYRLQENPQKALSYLQKAAVLHKSTNSAELINTYNQIGICYGQLGNTDSALYYFNRGYEIAGNQNPLFTSRILRGLGNVHTMKGDVELALSYYRKSLLEATLADSPVETCQTYIQLSQLFIKTNQQDSAVLYGSRAMQLAEARKSKTLLSWAAKQLAEVYESTNAKEALRYYKLAAAMKDEIFGAESQAQVQTLTFNELERQREMAEERQKKAEERKHNLQYAAIALGLVSLVIVFFLLSHTVIANPTLIRFFGVIALLILFEYLNLLLHPYLGELTHHSPVWMLLIMVCIAALLVPLHHRLEHWVIHRMVEKNNRIRLAAAKRTITQLGEINEPDTVPKSPAVPQGHRT